MHLEKASENKPVVIVGGGPAGSVAALCLRRLGREVIVVEKQRFPRYRIGESLLPGTMSILSRLDLFDRIAACGFPKKRAATFIWGESLPPWTFSFATPKTAPWVFDHSFQVSRSEFDQILIDAASERGATVHQGYEVTDVDPGGNGQCARVDWTDGEKSGTYEAGFAIDASGSRGIIANKLKVRRWDDYYRNMAVWSYFRGGKQYKGDLEGNIFCVAFKEGWIWIIPLKEDVYSVGVVTDRESAKRMKEIGLDAFYHECLAMCPLATETLETAERCDEVRVLREWSYESSVFSTGRSFLCGDSACFIDPLFSSGVHLATYSAMLAASAIDYLYDHPEDAEAVHRWYDNSYRSAYNRYHKFIAAFYACHEDNESSFWSKRKIQGAKDSRFAAKDWFVSMTGQQVDGETEGINELEERAAVMAHLWHHSTSVLSDDYDAKELSLRRVKWASDLLRDFRAMTSIRWKCGEVRLHRSFSVSRDTFKLERSEFLGDDSGRMMSAYPLTEDHRKLFEQLNSNPIGYRELVGSLKQIEKRVAPIHIVGRLFEEGFLEGRDKDDQVVKIRSALRFGGVGADDDLA